MPSADFDEAVGRTWLGQLPEPDSGAMPIQGELPSSDQAHVFDLLHHPTLVAAFASAMATSRAMSA